MKRILLIALLAVVCCGFGALAQKTGGKAAIQFDSLTHDFGTIGAEGGPVSHTFTFTNTGDAPLIIVSATASCGCTRPEYTTSPVKPGKTGTIKVTYLPSGQPLGEFSKTVRVRSNAGGKRVSLQIGGVIVPGTKSTPAAKK